MTPVAVPAVAVVGQCCKVHCSLRGPLQQGMASLLIRLQPCLSRALRPCRESGDCMHTAEAARPA